VVLANTTPTLAKNQCFLASKSHLTNKPGVSPKLKI
jgi:hypothetical protein